jgi:predicted CopG family antitoxin
MCEKLRILRTWWRRWCLLPVYADAADSDPSSRGRPNLTTIRTVLQGTYDFFARPFFSSHPNLDSRRVSTLSTRMSHQVRLEDDVYERIKANKRDDESFSDAVERLIGGRSLRDLRGVFDEDQVNEMRDAIEKADQQDRDEVREIAERFE